jgi:hypothetical protein
MATATKQFERRIFDLRRLSPATARALDDAIEESGMDRSRWLMQVLDGVLGTQSFFTVRRRGRPREK